MEILGNFGFEPIFFIAQIVNFLILFVVFKIFLYKPVLKVLDDRKQKISQGLKDAEKAIKDAAEAETAKEEIIKNAGKEAEKIMDDTKKTAEELKEKILTEAKESAEKMMVEAKMQANLEMENMEKRAKSVSLDLSKHILAKLVDDLFTKEEKEKIMKRSMDTMKKMKTD